jgi:hypothetical protein
MANTGVSKRLSATSTPLREYLPADTFWRYPDFDHVYCR